MYKTSYDCYIQRDKQDGVIKFFGLSSMLWEGRHPAIGKYLNL